MSSAINDSSYFVPDPSKWPAVGSLAMVFTLFGATGLVNSVQYSEISLIVGFSILIYMFFGWFGQVAEESEGGKYEIRLTQASGGQWDGSFSAKSCFLQHFLEHFSMPELFLCLGLEILIIHHFSGPTLLHLGPIRDQ